jgi:hypothetical protein
MKLHLIILACLLNLTKGQFMAELKGSLTAVPCTGEEFADFKQCLPANVAGDQEEAIFISGGERKLQTTGWCRGCRFDYAYPKGSFCFTFCGTGRRLEEGTGLRHLQDGSDAEYTAGEYSGTGMALAYAKEMIECLGTLSAHHPCLGDTANMTLAVYA